MDLSPRLKLIFQYLDFKKDLWDIGCDHGYLGKYVLEIENAPRVHFVDRISHLVEALREDLGAYEQAHFYNEDASIPGCLGEITGNLVIAGMGAKRMLDIIQSLEIQSGTNMILNPFKDIELLEAYLKEKNYIQVNTADVNERGRQRRIYHFKY